MQLEFICFFCCFASRETQDTKSTHRSIEHSALSLHLGNGRHWNSWCKKSLPTFLGLSKKCQLSAAKNWCSKKAEHYTRSMIVMKNGNGDFQQLPLTTPFCSQHPYHAQNWSQRTSTQCEIVTSKCVSLCRIRFKSKHYSQRQLHRDSRLVRL